MCSAREYTTLAATEMLHSRQRQLHSNQGDIETSVTWKAGPISYTEETVSDFISVKQYVIVV